MLLGIDIPWNSAPKKLPFFALFLNDQNAKDTEKEGARSRRGEEHGRRCGGSIHEINSSQKFSWKCWCLFSPQKWGRFWCNLRCCIWFHPLTWKMFFGRQVFFWWFRPIFRGYVCFRQGGTLKRKREEDRQGEGSHSGAGLMASNSAGIVRLTGDITRWRGHWGQSRALSPRRSGRDLLHFGDCGLHGHDVEEVSGASRDCISSRGQAVVGAGSGNWNAAGGNEEYEDESAFTQSWEENPKHSRVTIGKSPIFIQKSILKGWMFHCHVRFCSGG